MDEIMPFFFIEDKPYDIARFKACLFDRRGRLICTAGTTGALAKVRLREPCPRNDFS
jgi:hypothetical protein